MNKKQLEKLYVEYTNLVIEIAQRADEINMHSDIPEDLDVKEKRMTYLYKVLESEGYF